MPTPSTETDSPLEPRSPMWRAIIALLAILGLQAVLLWAGGALPLRKTVQAALLTGAMAAVAVALWPGLRKLVESFAFGRRVGHFPSLLTTIALFVAATCYLYLTAVSQERAFEPSYQDEYSYLLQARLLTTARLWTAAPPAAEWFESFQVISAPVYASIYFPGAAMIYAGALLIDLPAWTAALVLAGLCVLLVRDIATKLFNPLAGWVAAVMLIGLTIFRLQSVMVMSQLPLLTAGLAMTALWLRWYTRPTAVLAALIGAAAGYMLITRPVDAVCIAIPIGITMAWRLLRDRSIPRRTRHAACATAAVLPWVGLQLIFNVGVTGSIAQSPFTLYARDSYPQTQYGFHNYDESIRPASQLAQKQAYYDQVARPLLRQHTPLGAAEAWWHGRLRTTVLTGLPHAVLLALLPAGLMMLRRREIAVVVAPLALFPIFYWPYAFFLPHYPLTVAPAVIVLALAGVEAIATAAGRFAVPTRAALYVAATAVSIVELPEFNRANFDEFFRTPQLRTIDAALAGLPANERAIVLFRFAEGSNPQEEPVYNVAFADVWQHRIVRAHDLGERNRDMLQQLPPEQRDRMIYLYDRATDQLSPLGRVDQLLSTPADTPPAP